MNKHTHKEAKDHLSTAILLLALLLASANWIQAAPDISGYYENNFTTGLLQDDPFLQDKNKIRLNMESQAGDHLFFRGSLIMERTFGKTKYTIADVLPNELLNQDPTGQLGSLSFKMNDSMYMDNAYATWQKKRTLITLGIQPITWGSGYAWNPTDIWNDKELLDPTYEKPGNMALRWEQGLGPFSLSVVSGISDKPEDTPFSGELKIFAAGFDWALTGTRKKWDNLQSLGLGSSTPVEQWTGGFWNSGQLFEEIGLWTESAFHYRRNKDYSIDKNFFQIVAGMDHTIGWKNGVYLMAEYLYDSDATPAGTDYSLMDWYHYIMGSRLALGQHNLFSGISYPFDLTTIALYTIANLSDQSVMLNPQISYSLNNETSLDLMGAIPIGEDTDQYGRNEMAGIVRLTVYW